MRSITLFITTVLLTGVETKGVGSLLLTELKFNKVPEPILQRVAGLLFPQAPLTGGVLKAAEKENRMGYFLKCFVAGRVGVRWARHRTPMRARPATPVRQPHVRNGTHELSVTRWQRILTAHNSRRPLVGELPLRLDQARRREGHVAGARGPSTDPVRPGLAQVAYDQLWGAAFARVIGVPLRQGAEYD